MIIFLQELVLQLLLWLLMLVDGIMNIFSSISGIITVDYGGEQVNLIELVITGNSIETIFWCIFILAVGLACIFTIVAVIKNMIASNKNMSSIIGKFFLSLLGTMAMLAVVMLGIIIANSLLVMIAEIFQLENSTKLSNAIFNACVGDWLNGYSMAEVDITTLTVSDIFGDYNSAVFGIWPTSWKGNGMVDPNTFLYLPSLIAGVALAIAMIIAVINLAKRVYEIALLYILMPVSMATLSLDDGSRFKNWREMFITKMLLAFGSLFAINIFLLVLAMITQITIDGDDFTNSIFLIFMIIGGAMMIPAGQSMFARLFGTADDMHAGGGFLRGAFYGGRIASALTIGTAMKAIKGSARIAGKIHGRKKNSSNGNSSSGDGGENSDSNQQYSDDGNNNSSSSAEGQDSSQSATESSEGQEGG